MVNTLYQSGYFPDISKNQINNAISEKFGFIDSTGDWSYNKRNCDLTKNYRYQFMMKLCNSINSKTLLISIDESSFSGKFQNKKSWVWLHKNQSLTKNFHQGSNFNIMGAISPMGLIGCQIISGRSNAKIFITFLGLIKRELKHKDYSHFEKVVI